MSGGAYDYAYGRIEDLASAVRRTATGECPDDQSGLRLGFAALLERVARAAFALEWADSGDTDFDESAREALQVVVSADMELAELIKLGEGVKVALDAAVQRARDHHG